MPKRSQSPSPRVLPAAVPLTESAQELAVLRQRLASSELEIQRRDLAVKEAEFSQHKARVQELQRQSQLLETALTDTPFPLPADGVDYERARQDRELLESYGTYGYLDMAGFMGDASVWGQPLGYGMQPYLNPLSTRVDRAQGRDRPFVITEIDLGFIRGVARIVCQTNCPAQGAMRNLVNYTVGGRGFQYAFAPKRATTQVSDGLMEAVQEVLDEFLERNRWCGAMGKEGELLLRSRRDGEYFLQSHCDRVGRTDLRIIEPEQITETGAHVWDAQSLLEYGVDVGDCDLDGTFGIVTAKHDVNTRFAYNAYFDDLGESDCLPASTIQHVKLSDTNIKRGISDFYGALKWFQKADNLLTKTAGGASLQAAIAGIRKHVEGVTQSDVQAFRASKTDYTNTAYMPGGGSRTFNNYGYADGTLLDVPYGMDWVDPPQGADRGPAFVEVAQAMLRWVATQWCMPEFMISGDASNNNYSSSLVSEAPFVKFIQALQYGYGAHWHDLMWSVIANAARYGRFARFGDFGSFQAIKRVLKLHVSYPTIETRDRKSETDRLKVLDDDGIISPKKRAAEEGYDYDEERAAGAKPKPAQITAKADGMDDSGGVTSIADPNKKPPEGGSPGGQGPEKPPEPKPEKQVGESAVLESLDKSKVHRNHGQFASTEGDKGSGAHDSEDKPAEKAAEKSQTEAAEKDWRENGVKSKAFKSDKINETATAIQPSAMLDINAMGPGAGLVERKRLHESAPDIRDAIRSAAEETDTEPTEAQKASGYYRKGRFRWHGLTVAIENPKGSYRRGVGVNGKEWSVKLPAHYGYFVGAGAKKKGADGDAVDVFVGPHPESELVFVVDQLSPDGDFDEHKVVAGTESEAEAKQLYLDSYSPGWKGLGEITPLTLPQFKEWLAMGDMSRPVGLHESAALLEKGPDRAPAGKPTTLAGKTFKPGEFIPKADMAKATPEEKKALAKQHAEAKRAKADKAKPKQPAHEIQIEDDDESSARFPKPAATRLALTSATRVGKGKDKRMMLADGGEAPEHIQKLAIPPAWKDVQIALDPNSDVQALGFMQGKNGKLSAKAIYSNSYNAKMAELKFLRVADMMGNWSTIDTEIKRDRQDPKKKDLADVTWLMMEQATRPGSESDSKGLKSLYGEKLTAKNVVLGEVDKKTGVPKVSLRFGDMIVPIKDEGAREEIARRMKEKQPLLDAKFWLKSHGATTLEGRHVIQSKDGVRLQFQGKEGVWHDHLIRDPGLAKMLLERKAASGEDGKLFKASAERVRKYVGNLDGGDYLTKDLRTARGNFIANAERDKMQAPKDWDGYHAGLQAVAEKVAHVLGNRWQQSLATYIAPAVFNSWRAGLPPEETKTTKGKKAK